MAVFANGPGTPQTATVTSSSTQVFDASAAGLSGVLKNLLVVNSGPATVYIGNGTTAAADSGTSLALPAGGQVLITGTAVDCYAITASGTATVTAGLATLSTTD